MKIAVIGTGYVGLVAGTCLSELGNEVVCVDVDDEKINKLNQDIIPIYEPGLEDMVKRNRREKRLVFTTNISSGIKESDVIFIAVGTPPGKDHRADLSFVKSVAKTIGENLNGYKVIVDKSTVPVGTADEVSRIVKETSGSDNFDVVSNPEFLREGEAINDFLTPDRIVIGTATQKAKEMMEDIYKGIARTDRPIVFCDVKSAEMIKYASNAMLATRISFMNEIARLCEKVNADVKMVAKGMGLDSRIGPRFLQAGVGYGGSCFPKDVQALAMTMEDNEVPSKILKAVEDVNKEQKSSLLPKVKKLVFDLKGKKIAVWGLAFKPKTDDMREAPSITLINQLNKEGAKVNAFDPEAEEQAKKMFTNNDIEYFKTPIDTVKDCDCLVIVTEWNEFRDIDREEIKLLLKTPNVIDGRNIWDPVEMKEEGFNYIGVGR